MSAPSITGDVVLVTVELIVMKRADSPLGVCPECKGFGDVLTFAPELIVPDESKSLKEGALDPWAKSWRSVAWPNRYEKARARRMRFPSGHVSTAPAASRVP